LTKCKLVYVENAHISSSVNCGPFGLVQNIYADLNHVMLC